MSSLRRVFAFLAPMVVLSAGSEAAAQTPPTTGTTSVALTASPVSHSIARTGFRTNDQINYADCHNNDVMTFSLLLSANHNSYGLEVWAGTGCQTDATRQTPTLTSCWKLYAASPNTTTPAVSIRVADLLYGPNVLHSGGTPVGSGGSGGSGGADTGGSGGTGGTDIGGSGGTDTGGTAGTTSSATGGTTSSATGGTTSSTTGTIIPTGTIVDSTDVATCDDTGGLPVVSQLTIYFMLVDGSSIAQGTIATYTAKYKLVAPNPPDTLNADIGDGLLPLHFGYSSSNNQNTDTTINGYQFYCDPPPGEAALVEAGITPSDAGLTSAQCQPSTSLVPGMRADDKFRCGSASMTALAGNATGLVNGVAYNVAVAATDTYQNTGTLSSLACNVPQPVNGFFKAYRAAGGQGGGGYCSFSQKREPLPLFALIGLASCLVLRRRRAA